MGPLLRLCWQLGSSKISSGVYKRNFWPRLDAFMCFQVWADGPIVAWVLTALGFHEHLQHVQENLFAILWCSHWPCKLGPMLRGFLTPLELQEQLRHVQEKTFCCSWIHSRAFTFGADGPVVALVVMISGVPRSGSAWAQFNSAFVKLLSGCLQIAVF